MAWTTPGTATAGEVLTAAFWNENVRDNSLQFAPLFTSWTTFTPTVVGSGGLTITAGNATSTGRYVKIGRLVHFTAEWTFGSTTSFAGSGQFSAPLPVEASTGPRAATACNAQIQDAGTTHYPAMIIVGDSSATALIIRVINAAGTYAVQNAVSSAIPMTWATGDKLFWGGIYEALSS